MIGLHARRWVETRPAREQRKRDAQAAHAARIERLEAAARAKPPVPRRKVNAMSLPGRDVLVVTSSGEIHGIIYLHPRPLVACLALAVLLVASTVSAQSVINPRTIVIVPSDDYTAQLADGTNITTGVRVQFFLVGVDPVTGSPVTVLDLCKPPLTTAGTLTVTGTACPVGGPIFGTPLVSNTTYFATATEYGPGGESGRSPASNPFALIGAPRPPHSATVE